MPFGNFAVQSSHQLFYLSRLNVTHKLRVSVWKMGVLSIRLVRLSMPGFGAHR
jgi:hypothetical protein